MPPRPPAKRQRKIVISDDEEPVAKSRKSKPGAPSKSDTSKKSKANVILKSSPKASPKKSRAKGKEGKANKSLHSFFGKATEEQRWARKTSPGSTAEDLGITDPIDDDFSDEARGARGSLSENRILDRRKALGVGSTSSLPNGHGPLTSSQRFARKLENPPGTAPAALPNGSGKPWAEQFSPVSLEELAVHKKKVKDVQDWLAGVFEGRVKQRILVLKGPAGSGKSTTMSLLSEAMNFSVSQWRNPAVAELSASFTSQFEDFLETAGAFSALGISDAVPESSETSTDSTSPHILLADEFPTVNTSRSSTLTSFQHTLLQYLTAAIPPRSASGFPTDSLASYPPLVLIITESLLTSATAAADSFTAHRLLGPEISHHPFVTMLEFNPIAPTLIASALELVVQKEAKTSMRRRIPAPAVFKQLSALGDVRSAVNSLEFLCVRGDTNSDWGGRTAAKGKARNNSTNLTKMERDALELITQREASLGIFHAVGKVVWNKRTDPALGLGVESPPAEPPGHLSHLHRPKISQVTTDDLLNEIGTDIATFTAALHENYVLSTNGAGFMDCAVDCMSALSDSDLLSPGSRQMTHTSSSSARSKAVFMQTGGVDMLRQNEISFQAAVRGLLFSLPSPVSRAPHPSGRKGDSFKMFYPASLRTWKESEEINDLITLEMDRLATLDSKAGHPRVSTTEGAVETWGARIKNFGLSTEALAVNSDSIPPRIWVNRDELLLDRLPYSTKLSNRSGSGSSKLDDDLQRTTRFSGRTLNDQDEDGEDMEHADVVLNLAGAGETTDHQANGIGGGLAAGRIGFVGTQPRMMQGNSDDEPAASEKLYLSDDDIED